MTFKEAAEMYFDIKVSLIKPSSLANFKHLYKDHISEYFDKYDIDDINSRVIQKFYNSLVTKKSRHNPDVCLSEKVIKDIVGVVKMIMYNAMAEGETTERVFKLKKPYGMRKTDNGQDDFLNEEDYRRLLELCTDKNYNGHFVKAKIFVLLALTTGVRIGEACGIMWSDIDYDQRIIHIRRTVQRITDIDGTSYIHIGDPKSDTSNRSVYILDILFDVLKSYEDYRNIDDRHTFVFGKGDKPNEPRTLRDMYRRFLKYNDIKYIRPHALRHTFCTYSLENGCDVKTISQLLGHSKTDITLDIYTHVTKNQLTNTIDKLNAMSNVNIKHENM